MMKIAICISGHSHNYKKGYYEIKKHFLDNYDCDVYLHTWKDTSQSLKTEEGIVYSHNENDYEEILNLYQPIDYYFQLPIPFDITNIKGHNLNCELNNILSEGYSVHACNNLCKDSEIYYDLIIKIKFNLNFLDFSFNNLSSYNSKHLNVFKYPENTGRYNEVNNYFALGNSTVMDIYSNLFTYLFHYIFLDSQYYEWLSSYILNPDKFVFESLLKYHLDKNSIIIDSIQPENVNYIPHIIK